MIIAVITLTNVIAGLVGFVAGCLMGWYVVKWLVERFGGPML